jgi:mannose-6-phosphate isomerase-like protein (cupin superfamily)
MSISSSKAEHYHWGEGCDGWHLLKSPGLSVIQEAMPPGTAEHPHYHKSSHQFFFVLEGVLTIETQERVYTLKIEEGLSLAPLTTHHVRNDSSLLVRFLVVSAPPSHGDRVAQAISALG